MVQIIVHGTSTIPIPNLQKSVKHNNLINTLLLENEHFFVDEQYKSVKKDVQIDTSWLHNVQVNMS